MDTDHSKSNLVAIVEERLGLPTRFTYSRVLKQLSSQHPVATGVMVRIGDWSYGSTTLVSPGFVLINIIIIIIIITEKYVKSGVCFQVFN